MGAANIMEDMSNAAVGKQFREESGDAWEPWRLFKLEEMIKNLRKQHEKKEKRKELWGRPGQKVRRALRKATPRQRKNILRRWNKTRARALLARKAEAERKAAEEEEEEEEKEEEEEEGKKKQ